MKISNLSIGGTERHRVFRGGKDVVLDPEGALAKNEVSETGPLDRYTLRILHHGEFGRSSCERGDGGIEEVKRKVSRELSVELVELQRLERGRSIY